MTKKPHRIVSALRLLAALAALFLLSAFQPFSLSALSAPAANVAALLKRPSNPADAAAQARQLLALLTPEERFELTAGSSAFGIGPIPRLGIPEINFTDASAGVHVRVNKKGEPQGALKKTTAFPCPLALAATWSPALAADYANAIAEEMRAGGIHVLLGPGMNHYRLSVGGRNFEYLGEDPFLASRIVESYVRSLQSRGVAATLKHFIGNETEFYRRGSNSIIDERALHEIYLPPFKAGVDAGAFAVMTSYNFLNGEWAGQNPAVINGLLRGDLGFQWLVMTDWTSVWDGVKIAASGQDLEKPSGFALQRDRAKLLGTPEIDRMALSILKTCIAAGFYEPNFRKPELLSRWPQHAAVARAVNDRAITLLQNNGILPLDPANAPATLNILVTGNCASRDELAGGGSGHVKGYDNKTCAQAMQELFPAPAQVTIAPAPTDEQIKTASLVLVFPGFTLKGGATYEGENNTRDRPFVLPDDALIRRAVALNPKTIVCIIAGGGVEMDWAPQAAAILHAYYGGQTGADAIAGVLSGKTNPSGKLPFSIEKKFSDSPGYGYSRQPYEILTTFPAKMVDNKIDMFMNRQTGDAKPAAGKPADAKNKGKGKGQNKDAGKTDYASTVIDIYNVHYKEGVFTGYRWYDSKNIEPRFPFGFGLSYTTFGYSDLNITKTPVAGAGAGNGGNGKIRVTFTLKNTGARAGEEVAQLYSGEVKSTVPRPARELKGFQRVTLAPGESKTVTMEVDPSTLGFWDVTTHAWKVNPGKYNISVGSSSRDLPLRGNVEL